MILCEEHTADSQVDAILAEHVEERGCIKLNGDKISLKALVQKSDEIRERVIGSGDRIEIHEFSWAQILLASTYNSATSKENI
jgi:hypothetical protein